MIENIYLRKLSTTDKEEFKKKIQESFGIAISEFDENPPVIPSDEELESAFNCPDNDAYCIYHNNEKVGGIVVKINKKSQINSLELFFIYKGKHGAGLGFSAWQEVEKLYPNTKVWRTVTPYFEKRNINFYVNKCGFQIVEYCNKFHLNPQYPPPENDILEDEDFFVFEKVM